MSRCLRTNAAGTNEAGLLTRVAWWNCFSGIAGDMALASLLDAGADLDVVVSGLEKIPVAGWHLEAARTLRGGLAATQLRIEVDPAEEQRERTWAAIRSLIDQADGLPERVRQRAQTVFARLAAAEGRLHGVPVDEVHFHEVGGLDAIVDVVGTCLALESLDVASVCSSPVALGNGTVKTAHGLLPVPVPAVIELLKDVPVYGSAQTVELATPTGAALLAGLAEYSAPPPGDSGGQRLRRWHSRVRGGPKCAPGGGRRPPDRCRPRTGLAPGTGRGRSQCRRRDRRGAGPHHRSTDGRRRARRLVGPRRRQEGPARPRGLVPGRAGENSRLGRVLVEETGTLGYREHHVTRAALDREMVEVEVRGVAVRVKAGPHRVKAEYEDCAHAATVLGLPIAEVARLAERAAGP